MQLWALRNRSAFCPRRLYRTDDIIPDFLPFVKWFSKISFPNRKVFFRLVFLSLLFLDQNGGFDCFLPDFGWSEKNLLFSETFFQKPLAFFGKMCYNIKVSKCWPLSQTVKTSPSHGEDMGSIPVGVTSILNYRKGNRANGFHFWAISSAGRAPGSQSGGQGFDPPMVHQRSTPSPKRWGASLVDHLRFGERPPPP